MISKKYLVTAILILLSTSVTLVANQYSKEYSICMQGPEASQGVTFAMMDCVSQEMERQDKKLNNNYKALKKNLSESRQKELLVAQRAWIKYRDANCGFYNDPNGGTMHRMFAQECMLNATWSRANELKNMLEIF